jgi:hypothetical protein
MNDKQRLAQWMKDNGYSTRTLAAKMGVSHTGIHLIANGPRPVSDAFKWRFKRAFGGKIADSLFVDKASVEPVPTP